MDPATRSSLLFKLALLACEAPGQHAFREGVLDLLSTVLEPSLAVFASVPPLDDAESIAARNVGPRWVLERWRRTATDLLALLRPPRRWLIVPPEEGARFLPIGDSRPVCLIRAGARTPSVVALSRPSSFALEDRTLVDQLQPVLRLGDERRIDVDDTVGARLSPRERQIFDYLVRGFRNEDIARALGTSPATVRNQLVRLYRKTGVASRSELVGLATSRVLGPNVESGGGAA